MTLSAIQHSSSAILFVLMFVTLLFLSLYSFFFQRLLFGYSRVLMLRKSSWFSYICRLRCYEQILHLPSLSLCNYVDIKGKAHTIQKESTNKGLGNKSKAFIMSEHHTLTVVTVDKVQTQFIPRRNTFLSFSFFN